MPPLDELTDRERRILCALVGAYIDRGEPVSSLWLATHSGLGLSSATVRNLLAALEGRGYVRQPHTSSGRVPTDLAYRCYVDSLLQSRRTVRVTREVEARLRKAGSVDHVLSNVSQELSRVCHQLGFALAPVEEAMTLQRIDFIPLHGTRVLVVVVARNGQVTHKVVRPDEVIPAEELRQAAAYLNSQFAGRPLPDVRAAVIERLNHERSLYDALRARALQLASTGLEDVATDTIIFIQGVSALLEPNELEGQAHLETLRALVEMIEEKHRLVQLLTEYIDGPGVTVVIGREHAVADLQPFSLVASTYFDGHRTGTVGIIGPMRMRYSRAIAAVDSVASALTRVLHGSQN